MRAYEDATDSAGNHGSASRATADAQSSSSFDWTMKLFGGAGRKATQSPNAPQSGRPGSTSARHCREERQSLMHSSDGDAFDDSDAISLLSNIANRVSRTGSSAAAARRRARALQRSQDRTCGMLIFNLQTMSQAMGCGLLGRRRRDEPLRRTRADSVGSVIRGRSSSRGRNETNAACTNQHTRSLSETSAQSSTSFLDAAQADSGDEDAGMLDDRMIARFGLSSPKHAHLDTDENRIEARGIDAPDNIGESQAHRKKALQEAAERIAAETEAEARKQKDEEDRLAEEEEAAIAKARRKAARRAAKQNKDAQQTSVSRLLHDESVEADAEAAAGGFDYNEQPFGLGGDEFGPYEATVQPDYENHDDTRAYSQYDDAEEHDSYLIQEAPGTVVHHHHYYHPPPAQSGHVYSDPQSTSFQIPTQIGIEGKGPEEAPVEAVPSEDEADIAGVSFGRKKNRYRQNTGSKGSASASGSGSGLRTGSIQPSLDGEHDSGSGQRHSSSHAYRESPSRHQRGASKSSNGSLLSYQSSAQPATTIATSIAPSLYAGSNNVYPLGQDDAGASYVEFRNPAGSRFGKSAVDADEFGIITAGSDKGGAGRVKKTYRDKRQHVTASQPGDSAPFEGFPGS